MMASVTATTAVGGKLFEVSRYITYFTQAGGVKSNPAAVILGSVAAPPIPVASVLTDNSGQPCATLGTSCHVTLQHSCTAGAIVGDPAVRLSQLIHAAARFSEANVCGSDYTGAL